MFSRLGPWCHDHRRLVLGVWIGLLVLIGATAGAVGSASRDEFSLPNVESRHGFDILDARVRRAGRRPDRHDRVPGRARASPTLRSSSRWRRSSPRSPRSRTSCASRAPTCPALGRRSRCRDLTPGRSRSRTSSCPTRSRSPEQTRSARRSNGWRRRSTACQIEVGGQVFASFEPPSSEVLGLAFAIIILILAFGSVLAMGLPVGNALFGIGIGVSIITLLTNVLPVPDFTTFLGIMIGLGVGIDYALLIVTRYREQLHAGHDPRESIGIAIDTAGRSVLFAGTTVVISLMGLLAHGREVRARPLRRSRCGASRSPSLASLTLLPALARVRGRTDRAHTLAGPHRCRAHRFGPRRCRAARPGAVGGVRWSRSSCSSPGSS